MNKHLLAAAAALALAAPVAAQAQEVPSYAAVQSDQQIHGRITSFDGAYNLQVRDDNGYVDNVELHDGTIINPTGLTLAPGMVVSILGDNAGQAFDANEIDTPYTIENEVPYYSGHPWSYYGPSIDLSFFFGNTGWWHGPGRAYDRNVTVIDSTRVNRTVVNDYAPRRVPAPQPIPDRMSPVFHATPVDRTSPVYRATPVNHTSPVYRATPVDRPAPRADTSAARGGQQHSAPAPRERSQHDRH